MKKESITNDKKTEHTHELITLSNGKKIYVSIYDNITASIRVKIEDKNYNEIHTIRLDL